MRMIELKSTDELAATLGGAGLPTEDLGRPGQVFWRFDDGGGRALGYAGLEGEGPDRLLRSVVIDAAARGRGHGRALVDAVVREAGKRGVAKLWLLTLDAVGFFEKAGFARAVRGQAPAPIASTAEFRTLCPDTAVCMTRACSALRD
jgi:N-acetylglutamate synthase-like GNAT family acetyltransferase